MTALTATLQAASASVILDVTAAPAGPVTIVRTDANGANAVRLRAGQVPIAGVMTVTDYEPALVGLVSYAATDSAGVTVTADVDFAGAVPLPQLGNIQLPQLRATPDMVTGYTSARESTTTIHQPIGRLGPIAVLGVSRMRQGVLETWHADYASAKATEVLLVADAGAAVLFRQADHPGMDMYFIPTRARLEPLDVARDGWRFRVSCDYVETRSPTLPLLGQVGWSWADVAATYSSWAAVRDAYADWAGLLTGPASTP